MKKLLFAIVLALFSVLAFATEEHSVEEKWIEELWIDVRSVAEFNEGHLAAAVNIPHTQIAGQIADHAVSKVQPIKLYCRSGGRAGIAKAALDALGYSNVSNEGGYQELITQLPSS